MSNKIINQYDILNRIGKGMLICGFILLAYNLYSGSLLAQNLGLLVILLSAIWFHFVKKWKEEYELNHLISQQLIQALVEGRDLQSGVEGFLAKKFDTVSVELPKQDFRDPVEHTKIKLAELFEEQRRKEAKEGNVAANMVADKRSLEGRGGESNSEAKLCIVGYALAEPEIRCPDEGLIIAIEVEGFALTKYSNHEDCSDAPASYRVVCREPLISYLDGRVDQGTVMQIVGEMRTVDVTDEETGSYFFAEEVLASEIKVLDIDKRPYTYVEADSSLYGPDGAFLKRLYCPKSVSWNQLVADDPENRSRGCSLCSERVMNLDVVPVSEVLIALKKNPSHCLFGSEKNVRYLLDQNRPRHPRVIDGMKPVTIYTARSIEDINRGASDGFWPDVRLVQYNTKQLQSKFAVSQSQKTGEIDIGHDLREGARGLEGWKQILDFTWYYPYYQKTPLAAYLVPKGLPAGTAVMVRDPIEDILGVNYGQGDTGRAKNVNGVWDGERIILNTNEVRVASCLG